MEFKDKALPYFSPALKKSARQTLTRAADWAVRNQVRDAWPNWNANKGRFPYHVLIDPKKRAAQPIMLSTCWKTARTAQGLYSAYAVTGKKEYLDAANRACDYVSTLQIFEPGYDKWYGAFWEDSPQGPHIALRDGMEAVQGFIDGYLTTGNERHLRRAMLGADFFLRQFHKTYFDNSLGYPFGGGEARQGKHFLFMAAVIPLAQLWEIDKKKKEYAKAAGQMMDFVLANHILPNGALGIKGKTATDHHTTPLGKHGNVASNDDGIGPSMLCAYRLTKNEKYLKAAIGMASFWADTGLDPATLASYPSQALFLSDLYRATDDKKYLPVIERFTRKIAELQYKDKSQPILDGCIIGEDMARIYDKKTKATDYVDLRITSYSLIALAKVAAEKKNQWGCAYSCFGW